MDLKYKRDHAFWLIRGDLNLNSVTNQEKDLSKNLNPSRARKYLKTRACFRNSLSQLFELDALKIPLNAPPSKPPILEDELGYVSISHCDDALLLGWANAKIGIDIERKNREFNYEIILNRFFLENEKKFISKKGKHSAKSLFLSMWVLKEAAIKWQKGSILKDLVNWEIKDNLIVNKLLKKELNFKLINLSFWIIGIVYEKKIDIKNPIICLN